ncbi:Deoxyhypusine synthase-domain-containing protein [Phaeosphaeria sp. MPI-PUGE-AT-0046c]|nr:Deoxyhypusine synthase-domain-containing protein [Phaeosphaeria sp. MPI-PUGE-AT-0046c]
MSSTLDSSAPTGATDAVLKPSAPVPKGSREVQGIDFNQYSSRSITVEELVGGYANMGFQATSVGEAVRIINDMRSWRDPESDERTTVFLGYTSNLISSGLRETLRYLVQHKHVAAIVTTAGGVEEDFIKCLAPTYLGAFSTPGAGLRQKGMNRIGNLVVPNSNYCAFEDWVVPILDKMLEEQEASKQTDEPLHWTPSKVIHRLGKEINDERSVYYWAWKNDIPVFCPALTDGSLGDMLYFHTFKSSPEQLRVDIVEDIRKINTIAVRAKRTGMIVLGGGIVKHHIANANLMRNGAESAVYVNTAQEFDGSDAGARPDEAVSWGKIKLDGDSVKVYAEATVVFPLIVAATFARVQQSETPQPDADMERYPPRSPNQLLHAQTPASPPPLPSVDVDMSSSVTTLAPAGQQHDREDANMDEDASLTGVDARQSSHDQSSRDSPNNDNSSSSSNDNTNNNNVAVEVAAVNEDAMDTTPDTDAQAVLENAATDLPPTTVSPPQPPANVTSVDENIGDQTAPIPPSNDVAQTENPPPTQPPPPVDPSLQPPPPPPPIEAVRSDSDSSDDDDGVQPWHPIQEDTSSPDEDELKIIEASTEHSALDHGYWESRAFLPLEEPEYSAGETGRIDWTINAYNGTRENPNRDIVMTSDVVTMGGHQWQIKFYPKGNDADYLSVYLECLSVMDPKKKSDEDQADVSKSDGVPGEPEKGLDTMETGGQAADDASSTSENPINPQHAPLPLLGSKSVVERKSVAAQVSVVLYNPTEPRVHYSRTALHRFCSGSPDWGWTRFHGPYYDIAHRMHGQRSALLRDDKLAFTGYIRVVDDETKCLWEHPNRENPWDSFAMTGLQSLSLGEDASAPGGNMISAVASWLLFKPFRNLLYAVDVPDPEKEQLNPPKPLLTALQKVLYMLRTQVEPGAGTVALDDVLDALDWYGIHDRLDKLDVIEVWEVLRAKLEEELRGTLREGVLESMFGPKRDYSSGVPSYRVPVLGVETMQEAVAKAANFAVAGQPLPEFLIIELDRQTFDVKTRSYAKVLNKVILDDRLTIDGTSYTLYGYSDSKDENQVRCLTKRQAIDEHEGKTGTDQVTGNDPVAYIAMYIRNDVAQAAFTSDATTESWTVPKWLRDEVEKDKVPESAPPMPPNPVELEVTNEDAKDGQTPNDCTELAEVIDVVVIESRVFNEHEGPGNFNAYDRKWNADTAEYVHSVQLASNFRCADIVEKLAPLFPNVQDQRQILFWFLEPSRGAEGRPQFRGTDWTLADQASTNSRIWVHILDFAELPELQKVDDEVQQEKPEAGQVLSEVDVVAQIEPPTSNVDNASPLPLPDSTALPEDIPMSEPEEPTIQPAEAQASSDEHAHALAENAEGGDTAMVEMVSADVPDPRAVDVLIPEQTNLGDTEMGGTQEDLVVPPPPPPPAQIEVEPTQPPPPERPRTPDPPPDEIYFFLKIWNMEKQTLESRGSHLCLTSARVDETVVKLLGLPLEDKKKLELWEEDEPTNARPIKHRRSFAQLDLRNTAIIIAAVPITAEQRSALADRAAFADPSAYLTYRAFARNFPGSLNGHFTYDYFSSQYYKGEVKNGHRHGHGTLIYHSGATYSGSFRLGQRHGHGLYTFQNGDTYDGDWLDNQQHGSGTFVEAATGNTYVGGWKNDKKFGEGVTHWKNAQEAERLCRICWDEPAEAAFYDCGHVVACLTCAREVQNCPVCRKRVLSAMKLYYVS